MAPAINSMALYYGLCGSISGDLVASPPRNIQINLRGKIIPVIDLRVKFGMDERKYSQKTCIIVVEVFLQETKKLMGVIVDTVSEVIGIRSEEIEENFDKDNCFDEEFFSGIAKVKDRVIILLDVEKILGRQELL